MNTGLENKVIVITGASGGIGSGIARAFAGEKAKVVLHYHRGSRRVEALRKELSQQTECICMAADLTKEAQVRRLFVRARERFGRVDTLIANAGAWTVADRPLHRTEFKQWHQTMEGVLTTTFLSVRAFLQVVAQQKQGNLVMIGSTAAIFGEAGHADYAGAKGAIAYGLTRTLKNEMARIAPHTASYCGGRVNYVCPGWTVVPRLAKKLGDVKTVRRVVSTMALPQLGRPEDVAHATVFLSSDLLARHITGQILVIAGGMEGRQVWPPEQVNPEIV